MGADGRRTLDCSPELFDDLTRELIGRGQSFRFRAWGQSMNPTIQNGDVIVAEAVTADSLRLGDIILYGRSGGHVAHRLVAVLDGGAALVTRGVANAEDDPPIRPEQVIARVISVEHYAGRRPLLARIRSRCRRLATALTQGLAGVAAGAGRAPR